MTADDNNELIRGLKESRKQLNVLLAGKSTSKQKKEIAKKMGDIDTQITRLFGSNISELTNEYKDCLAELQKANQELTKAIQSIANLTAALQAVAQVVTLAVGIATK